MLPKIKVLVAANQSLMKEGLNNTIAENPFFEVIGDVSNGGELCEKYFQLKPDIILADMYLPGITGIQAVYKIKEKDPNVKGILYSVYDNPLNIFYALKAGAKGFLNRNAGVPELIYAILLVYEGKTYFGKNFTENKLDELVRQFEDHHYPAFYKDQNLTDAEKDVLFMLCGGSSSKMIAEKLHKSKKTVDNQIFQVKKKLNIKTTVELFKFVKLLKPELFDKPYFPKPIDTKL